MILSSWLKYGLHTMSQYIELQYGHISPTLLQVIVDSLKTGAVMAYPTDSGYALACKLGAHKPLKRIQEIRQLSDNHNYSLICRGLSEIARYAKVDTAAYRILKRYTPGGYTFILPATSEVPKLMQSKKKTVGIRIPDHQIALDIAKAMGEPFLSTSLILPGADAPLLYPDDIVDTLNNQVDIIIDCGYCGFEPTSVVDLTEGVPIVRREGSGDISWVEP